MSTERPRVPFGMKIGQIILEEASFKHRGNHLAIASNTPLSPGSVDVELEVGLDKPNNSGLARVRIKSTSDGEHGYDIAVTLAAILNFETMPVESDRDRIAATGALMLFPFAREAVANITSRGRFGPVWLQPFGLSDLASGGNQQPSSKKSPK